MLNKYKKTLYLLLLLFSYFPLHAQTSFDSSYTHALSVYKKAAGVNVHLYNGSEYIDYDHRITGNPFFNEQYFTNGSLVFDGILYSDVKMFYDIVHDDLVIKNYNETPLILTKEKVSSFNISSHYFINVIADSTNSGAATAGFYDVLYDGKTKLFAKRKKEFIEKMTTQYSESYFKGHDAYYIFKNNIFYQVNDKRSALSILKDRKNDVQKYLHQNKVNFQKNIEVALYETVAYYDGLNNNK